MRSAPEPIDKAALVELAHEARIDQIFDVERGDPGILLRHQPLEAAQAIEGRIGPAIEC